MCTWLRRSSSVVTREIPTLPPILRARFISPEAALFLSRVVEEIAIVQPRIVVVMGADALAALGEMEIPLARELQPRVGEIQQLTTTIDALYVPNIDDALDETDSKRAFWAAFRTLGDWHAAQPPY